jgi:hypothetical protein
MDGWMDGIWMEENLENWVNFVTRIDCLIRKLTMVLIIWFCACIHDDVVGLDGRLWKERVDVDRQSQTMMMLIPTVVVKTIYWLFGWIMFVMILIISRVVHHLQVIYCKLKILNYFGTFYLPVTLDRPIYMRLELGVAFK